MKPIKALLTIALIAAGFAASVEVQAQAKHGWGGNRGGGHQGGRWHGGGYRHWGHGYGSRLGFYVGAPIVFGSYYWGHPWNDWYDDPRVVYREVIREPEFIEAEREPSTSTEGPRGEGAPAHGPTYMNYCESARAYFPKVTRCPEGWKFITPRR